MKDLQLVYNDTTRNITKRGFNQTTRAVTGAQYLIQLITKMLLTVKGTDYDQKLGSLLDLYKSGSAFDIDPQQLTSYINILLKDIEDQIKKRQAGQTLADDERLISLELKNIEVDEIDTSIYITILVTTAQNNTYLVRL